MEFNYTKDKNNIVTLTMDMAEKSANLIDEDYFKSLLENIVKLENESDLKGVILTSAKKTFLAGADLEMLYSLREAKACYEFVEAGKLIMRRFEQLGKPIVAAINGTALGAGMELALCCHYRIAIDNPVARFGFPEVNLGILPGAGGTVRLPRLIGLESSLPLLLEGKQMSAQGAFKSGIMDELALTTEEMFAKAKFWIDSNADFKQPWDRKNYRFPGGNAQHPENVQMIAIAPAVLRKKTRGNYPAPEKTGIRDRMNDIRGVDIKLTFRSKEFFFNDSSSGANQKVLTGLSGRDISTNDRYLRDSVIVTVGTRNIGGQAF